MESPEVESARSVGDLFRTLRQSTTIFDEATFAAVQAEVRFRGPKSYVRCLIRNRDVPAKPEEIIRQLWLHRLTKHYGYPVSRLTLEFPITFGRDSSKRADVVVFDGDRPTVPYVIIEVKQGTVKSGKEQLKSYTHATGAPLALWSDGTASVVWHRKNPNYFVELPDLPNASQTIEDIAGQPWTVETLVEKEQQRLATGVKARSLRQLIEDLEDEVLANAGVDVFEEVFKLIFTKLYDEMACHRKWKGQKFLGFRNQNTAAQLKIAIQSLFEEANKRWEGVFPPGEKIKLTPDHLQVCVGSLEEWKLFNSNLDVVDDAFEYLVNKSSKGEKGQYFTPRWVIDMCVKMLDPKESEFLVDPACGSAGFTVHSFFHVWKSILQDEGHDRSHLFTMDPKPPRCDDYVREKVFGIDFDEKSVRVARCLNLIAGDGQSNILHLNSLDWKKWEETTKQEDWSDTYHEGWKRFRRMQAERGDPRAFKFDLVMANPPFAGDLRQPDLIALYELGRRNSGQPEDAIGRDILFVERCLDLLKPGGRLAIVLPQGRLNNENDTYLRQFISERCRILAVVSLHANTFKPHTGTKTSVLFAQRWNDNAAVGPLCPKTDEYRIFFGTQQVASKNTRGEKILVKDQEGNPIRDSHGHWVVAHDLFNHDGLTQDGIAEEFARFVADERLSFAPTVRKRRSGAQR